MMIKKRTGLALGGLAVVASLGVGVGAASAHGGTTTNATPANVAVANAAPAASRPAAVPPLAKTATTKPRTTTKPKTKPATPGRQLGVSWTVAGRWRA